MDNPTLVRSTAILGITTAFYASGFFASSSLTAMHAIDFLPASAAVQFFRPFFYRGGYIIVPLSLVSVASFGVAAYFSSPESHGRTWYAVAAGSVLLTLPYTKFVVLGGVNSLLECAEPGAVGEKALMRHGEGGVKELLRRWKGQNMVRSVLVLVGAVVGGGTYVS